MTRIIWLIFTFCQRWMETLWYGETRFPFLVHRYYYYPHSIDCVADEFTAEYVMWFESRLEIVNNVCIFLLVPRSPIVPMRTTFEVEYFVSIQMWFWNELNICFFFGGSIEFPFYSIYSSGYTVGLNRCIDLRLNLD